METRDGYRTGVRPNHWIPGHNHKFIGQVVFDDGVLLKPGEKSKPTLNGKIANQDKNYSLLLLHGIYAK